MLRILIENTLSQQISKWTAFWILYQGGSSSSGKEKPEKEKLYTFLHQGKVHAQVNQVSLCKKEIVIDRQVAALSLIWALASELKQFPFNSLDDVLSQSTHFDSVFF